MYFPYLDNPSYDDNSLDVYYVSYDPLNGADFNEAYYFPNSGSYDLIDEIDNKYTYDNPVFLIIPIDDCDIEGRECLFIELEDSNYNPIDNSFYPGINDVYLESAKDIYARHVKDLPYDPNLTPILLTHNENHADITDDDLLSVFIPRIQLNSGLSNWLGFAATHLKLTFYRASADGKITIDPSGKIDVDGNPYKLHELRFRKARLDGRWVDFDVDFDSDWKMSENEQGMGVFTKHNISASATAEFNPKFGLKLNGLKIVPTVEATGSVKVTVKESSAKLRANIKCSRRQHLASIIGPGITEKTIWDGGVEYNVKKIGYIGYYQKMYFTKLTE